MWKELKLLDVKKLFISQHPKGEGVAMNREARESDEKVLKDCEPILSRELSRIRYNLFAVFWQRYTNKWNQEYEKPGHLTD